MSNIDLQQLGVDDLLDPTPQVISASVDPELATAQSAAALSEAIVKPEMKNVPPGTVDLPGGWLDPWGGLQKTAMVKELTGRDEERLSRIDDAANLPLFLQTMVECGVETIGGQPVDADALKDLLIGDREALILGIRIATYGDDLPLETTCPRCQFTEKISLELHKDIPVKQMETPEVREYPVTLKNGKTAIIQPATARIQDTIWDPKKNIGQLKTASLLHCIKTIDGVPVNIEMVRDMGLQDRNAILDRLAELQPGPDYGGVRLDCQGCGNTFPLDLSLADLFRS